ncbi:nucleoside hydrolase, partial [Candidatus Bathyarchaeota archaeon]|nr:nucleoside hydrolase [Candidatus Bathyarchaeota archaeon]
MEHIIIDTDPGVDDALAILLAFASPELNVEAVTIVVGNVSLEQGSVNALKLLEFLGVDDVPVAAGAVKPMLRGSRDARSVHGDTGLGEAVLPEPRLRLDSRTAVEVILQKADEYEGELTLIPVGPLTNIAAAVLARPRIVEQLERVVIMGGAFGLTPYGKGNVNSVAEFNIWHDPEAAQVVFDSGVPLTAVGLDVTTDPSNQMSKEMHGEIDGLGTERAGLVADRYRGNVLRRGDASLHDPRAVAAVLAPDRAGGERQRGDVEGERARCRGQTEGKGRFHPPGGPTE